MTEASIIWNRGQISPKKQPFVASFRPIQVNAFPMCCYAAARLTGLGCNLDQTEGKDGKGNSAIFIAISKIGP
jgi:hypothetical protein